MKVVINRCYGAFSLSRKAYKKLGLEWDGYGFEYSSQEKRVSPELIKVVEELGEEASGDLAKLKVVEIPDDIEFTIEEYDGIEWIAGKHETWR